MTGSPLHVTLLPTATPPSRWMVFLHGILGTGSNLRALARRLTTEHPGWGAALVDLRLHGQSRTIPGPHSVAAAATDLQQLDAIVPGPIRGVTGHSFGGKVAMAWMAQRQGLELGWVLDAMPGPRPGGRGSEGTLSVFDALDRAGKRFATREEFVQALMREGLEEGTSRWLGMNIERVGDSMEFVLDLPAIRSMLDDYFQRDLWPVVESPPAGLSLHLVIGGRSNVFDASERMRAEQAARRSGGRVHVHLLPGAGPWVHVDDPDGLFALMSASM